MPWQSLADAVLVVHALFVAFVVIGLAVIVVGLWRGWGWVRNRWFRGLHLAAIVFVASQSWAGIDCPLTTIESALRVRAGAAGYRESFVQDWLYRLLYYQASPRVFTVAYTLFALAVAATWWWGRPRRSP